MDFSDLIIAMQYLTQEQREDIYQQVLKQVCDGETEITRITIRWPIPLEKLYMTVIIPD